jgi:hypothetical protein
VLSRQLIDSVKDIQDTLEAQWDYFITSELLLESTFGELVLEEENMVHLTFNEIDIQNKMEQEKHKLEMFQGNAITWDELRAELNREPIPVPENGDDQDPAKYPEWFNTYWKLFGEPENLIRSVDEPYSLAAKVAAEARTLGTTTGQIQQAGKEQAQAQQQQQQQKNNQQQKQDNFIRPAFSDLENDVSNRIQSDLIQRSIIDEGAISSLGKVWSTDTINKLHSEIMKEFIRGFNDYTNNQASNAEVLVDLARTETRDRIAFFINKLTTDTLQLIKRRVDPQLQDATITKAIPNVVEQVHLSFDAVKYRTDYIWDTERRKAYNYGRVLGMRHLNEQSFTYEAAPNTNCEKCKTIHGRSVLVLNATLDDMPPLHPNSQTTIRPSNKED